MTSLVPSLASLLRLARKAMLALLAVSNSWILNAAPESSVSPRQEATLGEGWLGWLETSQRGDKGDGSGRAMAPFTLGTAPTPAPAQVSTNTEGWAPLTVPHNWEAGEGLTGRRHANLHGVAWYRRTFEVPASAKGRRVHLFFEGAGSYAEVWVNGRKAGQHAGGLTCFNLDITEHVAPGTKDNVLAIRVAHPAGIRDLPWVCGGCERAYGFSEGSQPFGLHRAVRLVITDSARIEPFGVHIWNDADATPAHAVAHIRTELSNVGGNRRSVLLQHSLVAPDNTIVAETTTGVTLEPGAQRATSATSLAVDGALFWSPTTPHLYALRSRVIDAATRAILDAREERFGFRTVAWPSLVDGGPLRINGKDVFLNGTCEYQHLVAGSHAFAPEMVAARMDQMRAAGFNSFRDAHHPHDLRYNEILDAEGMPWWTQFSAHIWFDTPAFRENFRTLLREWIRERRNSPSLVLWGLQNECNMPADFAAECTALIREMDPTSPSQRLVTTCNGGAGTDWDVPQNWSGTYYGTPATYAEELRKQILVGEYGAWRSQGLLDVSGSAGPDAGNDETAFATLMGTKLRLGATMAGKAVGHFQWIFATHENPGRNMTARGDQIADGWGPLGRLGPANNKGLLTLWGEPTDTYYLYRAHAIPAAKSPLTLIAGATSPDRWLSADSKADVTVHTNCDEVLLYDGDESTLLGRQPRPADGAPVVFRDISPRTNTLLAVGQLAGRPVSRDALRLHHRPTSPARKAELSQQPSTLPAPADDARSVVRVNCGGPTLIDSRGRTWQADAEWRAGAVHGAHSWASAFPELDPALGSIARISTPVTGTRDEALYQTFRHGGRTLRQSFALPDGNYEVILHMTEPWYGRGGIDARRWRLFDIAINGETRVRDLDLFAEAGFGRAVTRTFRAQARKGLLEISFPRCAAYTAVLCGVEILAATPAQAARVREALLAKAGAGAATRLGRSSTGEALYPGFDYIIAALPPLIDGATRLVPATPEACLDTSTIKPAHNEETIIALPPTSGRALPQGLEELPLVLTCSKPGSGPVDYRLVRPASGQGADRDQAIHAALATPGSVLFLLQKRAPAQAQLLSLAKVQGDSAPEQFTLQGRLSVGARPHGPASPAITALSGELGDADWLASPSTGTSSLSLTLKAEDHLELFVALPDQADLNARLPSWLADFTASTAKLTLGSVPCRLFRRRFSPGDLVTLGAPPSAGDNEAEASPMYCVFARPARPLLPLPELTTLGLGQSSTRTFEVGVGDRYHLVPQLPLTEAPLRVRIELLGKDGASLCSSDHDIAPGTRGGQLRVRTCTSINAGTYQARITLLESPAPIEFRGWVIE